MNKVKVAVVGYGHLGKWHCQKAEAINTSDFIAIVESFEPNQQKAKEAHPNVKVVSSIDEVMDEVDAFVISTPTSTHFEITKKLLENKKHVFCEKPICDTYEEVLELEKMSQRDEVVLQVGHSERFHIVWERLKTYLNDLPRPFHLKLNRVAAFKGRATDVDVVQDLMVHDLDLIKFFDTRKAVKAKWYWSFNSLL
jgi:predicted dehydrogenase